MQGEDGQKRPPGIPGPQGPPGDQGKIFILLINEIYIAHKSVIATQICPGNRDRNLEHPSFILL